MLNIIDRLDEKILSLPAHRLHEELEGPTLVHIKGQKDPALFLSVLLHGNESSGWEVVKNILNDYKDDPLPRSLTIFIGNVKAARYKKRKLENQPDFNRVWSGGDTEEHAMMSTILDTMQQRGVFASIDIHNNNGLNPHYACLNKLDNRFLKLARLFSRMVIYFIRPSGVQSLAFSKLCPAVTLETGQPGDEYGIQIATKFVETVLALDNLEQEKDKVNDIDLYHTIGIIKIPDELQFSFDDKSADIEFIKGIEGLNFKEIVPETKLCSIKPNIEKPFIVLNENGEDVFDKYFRVSNNHVYTKSVIMPAMLTIDEKVIRQDCLCYLMEHYNIQKGEKELIDDSPLWM